MAVVRQQMQWRIDANHRTRTRRAGMGQLQPPHVGPSEAGDSLEGHVVLRSRGQSEQRRPVKEVALVQYHASVSKHSRGATQCEEAAEENGALDAVELTELTSCKWKPTNILILLCL